MGRRTMTPTTLRVSLPALLSVITACSSEVSSVQSEEGGLSTCPRPAPTSHGHPSQVLCPHGVEMCARNQACVAGTCGSCSSSDQCRPDQACLPDRTCGACSSSTQCQDGRSCIKGQCLAPLRTYELSTDPDQWDQMRIDERYSDIMIPCTLTHDGTEYPDCEVGPRGESSRDYRKLPLRIHFPKLVPHPGYRRKMNLRSEFNDMSYLRVVLAHETIRRLTALPVPMVRFVRLHVNGGDYGIYLETERVDDDLLRATGRSELAPLFEADPVLRTSEGMATLLPLPDSAAYQAAYDLKIGVVDDYEKVRSLIEDLIHPAHLSGNTCELRDAVNLEQLLDYVAVMALLQGKDHVRKNYYFSLQPMPDGSSKWEFYPWDLDLTFGCIYTDADLTMCRNPTARDSLYFGMLPEGEDASYPTPIAFNLLLDVVLRDAILRAEIDRRLCEMINSEYWTRELPELIDGWEEALLPEVSTDKWDNNEGPQDFAKAVDQLRNYVRDRRSFVLERLSCSP